MSITSECPVPILQDDFEFSELLKIYKEKSPKEVLEIGTFYGGTMWYWINRNWALTKLTCIDLSITPRDRRYEKLAESKEKWQSWRWWKAMTFNFVEGKSQDDEIIRTAWNIHLAQQVDWLFIDGSHEYKDVRSDFENYFRLVKPGGTIIFHDTVFSKGVRRVWKDVKKNFPSIEIYRPKTGFGIGIIQKT